MIFLISMILSLSLMTTPMTSEIPSGRDTAYYYIYTYGTEEMKMDLPMEYLAYQAGMDVEEFEFLARVIEAESDRSQNLEAKTMIAACIINRVNSDYFPDTISSVLTQEGQFTTVSGGWCSMQHTRTSRYAIISALEALENDEIPTNVLFFNCIGYNYGTPYGVYGDNYFMTYGPEVEYGS